MPGPYIRSFCPRDIPGDPRCISGPNGECICEERARKAVAILDDGSRSTTRPDHLPLTRQVVSRRPATDEDLRRLLQRTPWDGRDPEGDQE